MPLVTRRFGTISPKPKEKTSINGRNWQRYVQICSKNELQQVQMLK